MTIPGEANSAITCSVSLGLVEQSTPPDTADDLMRRADERLYVAKKSGKNRRA
jgi:PleD family two-component response regulator